MISVIVPTLIKNDKQLNMTLKCLSLAYQKTELKYELIIVETESDWLQDYADIYIWERFKTNATKSINRGFKVASGDYLVLLTNDVMVSDGWLEALQKPFFEKEDCGLTTLGTTQLGHRQANMIEEGIWFSVAMFKKQDNYFDEGYVNSWDDTDFIMRHYLDGKKMYRNYECIVDHLVGQTQYEKPDHQDNFFKNEQRFKEKFKAYSEDRMFKVFTEGVVI